MKKVIALLIAVCMVFALAACGAQPAPAPAPAASDAKTEAPAASDAKTEAPAAAPDKVYTLRLATQVAQPNPLANSAYRFAEDVAAKTNGQVKVDVYPSNQLGDYTSVFEELDLGTIDLAWISASSAFNPMIDVQGIPYIFENWDQARAIWLDQDGFLFKTYKEANESYGNQNVLVMGVVPGGFLGICIAKDTKVDYSNADMFAPSVAKKDLLIRNPSMDVAAMIVNGLGFNSFNLSWSELYNALQTGVVNGAYGAGAGTVYTDLRDVVSAFYDFRYLMEMMAMYASKSSLDKLPADLAQIVVDCAVAEQYLAFDEYEEFEKEGYQQLLDYGIDVIYPTDEEMAAMAAEMRDIVWPQLYDLFGEDTMTGIRAQVEGLK
ncbi:MAG: TRAP transporter substrate-binding protein DctP [Oscillospiraceae bacterium]|nr:TRAP transporter substrate-binding protein DctP [Oscillospiraceae bacterium]